MEHLIRACRIALRLADLFELDPRGRAAVYYSGLLAWVGCHTDAYEQAKWFGDDLRVKREAHYGYDLGRPASTARFMLTNVAALPRSRSSGECCRMMSWTTDWRRWASSRD